MNYYIDGKQHDNIFGFGMWLVVVNTPKLDEAPEYLCGDIQERECLLLRSVCKRLKCMKC